MAILAKVMNVLIEDGPVTRTKLAQVAGVHYDEMSKQLDWLEKKQYVKIEIRDRRIVVVLTQSGEAFAAELRKLGA